jgi:hypothetical protein
MESQDLLDVENESWWFKLEPMLSTFYIACQEYLIPGTEVAIDEM